VIVYLVTNRVNGKRYVGKTKRDLDRRWYEHVTHSHGGSEAMALYRAIRKHGPDAFDLSVLEECDTEEQLDEAEKRWIRELGTFGREYNMTEGGDGLKGYRHTEETKRRMSESRKGSRNHFYGKKWGRQGPLTEEIKEKLRQAHLGLRHTEASRGKISEVQYVRVVQSDAEGNPLATYLSLKDAEVITGIKFQNISRACRFSHRTAGGYRWQYLNPKGE